MLGLLVLWKGSHKRCHAYYSGCAFLGEPMYNGLKHGCIMTKRGLTGGVLDAIALSRTAFKYMLGTGNWERRASGA